jgi:YebC/PmpR family DNA-binding regulatory protein
LAGHNKWSQIKRKKAVNDAARGKAITKHIRAVQTAVREGGGGDPETNARLRNALAAAKTDDVTGETLDRAIERALGSAEGGNFEEAVYEGYGPAGVAILVEALTDNRNRTAGEVRHVFTKHGGNMSGSTAWQFDSKGVIVVPAGNGDSVLELAIELGAEDFEHDDEMLTIYTAPADLFSTVEALQSHGIEPEVSQLTKVPQTETELTDADAGKVLRILESFEDLDDVQNVYSTANLDNISVDG